MVDLETTGLCDQTDYVIEAAALKIRNGTVTDSYSTLVKPPVEADQRIEQLTGITNEMLLDAPPFQEIGKELLDFLGNDLLVGHSVGFDVGFLTQYYRQLYEYELVNEYTDTFAIAKRLLPELMHYRLVDLAAYYSVGTQNAHRALSDCYMTYQVYESMKRTITRAFNSYERFIGEWDRLSGRPSGEDIRAEKEEFDSSHPFYKKNCVITGVLEGITRREAMQTIADAGGRNVDKVNTSTDYLIVGDSKYLGPAKGLSAKHKKALRLNGEGCKISIIREREFIEYAGFYEK